MFSRRRRPRGVRRVVHCSTGGVHGHIANPPANEDAPFNPGDVYQETKLDAEQAGARVRRRERPRCRRRAADRDLRSGRHAVPDDVPRPGARPLSDDRQRPGVLSPDVHRRSDRRVSVVRHRARRRRAAPTSSPVRATRRSKQLVRLVAKELNVAPPRVHLPVWPFWTAGLLCEMVCVPLRIEPPIYRRRVDFYTKSRAFDTTRARTELGFAPKVDLEEGIKRTADWYRSEGLL